ncbi:MULTISPECIES: nitroreductase family protein [unclassified Campylobacter]|uniref:nitroreductase family protein n=1 Tax=unclassified Campylobacter TaxID=2593542 RepID=UPI0022E9B267|nr:MULTISPECIES: nitroreductase family protein [unclassified Campylobacter]MDA3054870.1 nitroreductase family protein [Campylobacter sp. VBCF_07 NA4]MDA3061097.1 nitroreductase family protein [Campylobacter sp. VBCF_02 NA5]MDA3070819.1 nitroreductase family protein [Campylobacter sp. VBCF_08 NA3]WBR54325.1 nitroreductase family protein [Campylobacter sp. VBCF_01 NA2]
MELLEAMQRRQSVRKFSDKMPSPEQIKAVLEAGFLAPALFTTKDAHISVITDKDLLRDLDAAASKKFSKMLESMGMTNTLYGAPVYVLISGRLADEVPAGFEFLHPENIHRNVYWTMGSLMQNMQLRATELGLSSCLINTVVVTLFDEPELAKRAGIPKGYSPLCSIVLGLSDFEFKKREPKNEHYQLNFI